MHGFSSKRRLSRWRSQRFLGRNGIVRVLAGGAVISYAARRSKKNGEAKPAAPSVPSRVGRGVEFVRRLILRLSVLTLALGAGFYYLTLVNFPHWAPFMEEVIGRATGTHARINGTVGVVGPFIRPAIYVEDVSLYHLPLHWADADRRIARMGRVEVHVNLWPLLSGAGYTEIDEVTVSGAEILLSAEDGGAKQLTALKSSLDTALTSVPDYYGRLTLVDVVLRDATVVMEANATAEATTVLLENLSIRDEGEALRIVWSGGRGHERFAFDGVIDRPAAFVDGGAMGIDMIGKVGSTELVVSAAIRNLKSRAFEVAIQAMGPDLSGLAGLLGQTDLPAGQPLAFAADLAGDAVNGYSGGISGTVGAGDISGSLALTMRDKIHFEAYLESERFDVMPFLPADFSAETEGGLDLTSLFRSRWTRRLEGVFSLRAAALQHGDAPLGSGDLMVALTGGIVDAALVERRDDDGLLTASLVYDTLADGSLSLSLNAQTYDVGPLARAFAPAAPIEVVADFGARLQTRGKTLAEWRENVEGQTNLVLGSGTVGSWLTERLPEALDLSTLKVGSKEETLTLTCLISRMDVEAGAARATTFLMETPQVVLSGTGEFDIVRGEVDATIWRRPRDPLYLGEASDLRVRGGFGALTLTEFTDDVRRGLSSGLAGLVLDNETDEALPLIAEHLPRDNACLGSLLQS